MHVSEGAMYYQNLFPIQQHSTLKTISALCCSPSHKLRLMKFLTLLAFQKICKQIKQFEKEICILKTFTEMTAYQEYPQTITKIHFLLWNLLLQVDVWICVE